jgi:hypothetical protein
MTPQEVSDKLVELREWLEAAYRELETRIYMEAAEEMRPTDFNAASEVDKHWRSSAIGQLRLLRDTAGVVLSTVETAYKVGVLTPRENDIPNDL